MRWTEEAERLDIDLCGHGAWGVVCGHLEASHVAGWCVECLEALDGAEYDVLRAVARHGYRLEERTAAA